MEINSQIFKELMKRGYSLRGDRRVWNISDSKLWFLTPALAEGFVTVKDKTGFYRRSVIEPELDLLKNNAKKIASLVGSDKFNLIDLSCCTGGRAEVLISNMPQNVNIRYSPVTVSSYLIELISKKIGRVEHKVQEIKPFISDFNDFEDISKVLRNEKYKQNVVMMLGSRISHYEINEILFSISRGLLKDDFLIIGNGIRQGERFVELEKYKSSLFNEWFINIMKGLGFNEDEVEYDARFENYRVEGFYRIKVNKAIEFNDKKVNFKKGDEVVVAVQYKFYESELTDFCKMYFREVEVVKSADGGHCLLICRK